MKNNEIFLDSLPWMTKSLALHAIDTMAENLANTFSDRDMSDDDIQTMNDALIEALGVAGIPLDDYLEYLLEKDQN